MKKLLTRLCCLIVPVICTSSCIFIDPIDIMVLTGKYYHSYLEPYYRVEYKLDDKKVDVVKNDGGGTADISRSSTTDIYFHGSAGNEIWMEVYNNSKTFKTKNPYQITKLNVLNKYGHLCEITGKWHAYFSKGGPKAYDLYQVSFQGDCLDPDTGQIYHIRDGLFTVCKNKMPQNWKELSDYLSE